MIVTTKAGKNLLKQECAVADVTGTSQHALWEGHVGNWMSIAAIKWKAVADTGFLKAGFQHQMSGS